MKARPDKQNDRPGLKSQQTAAKLALGYLLLSMAYILLSSHAVAQWSGFYLEYFEQSKGLAFVVISGLLFFEFARRVLLKIELRERELERNQEALLQSERRALAGTLAASVAHDMNNILTIAGADLEELADPAKSPDRRDALADQVQRALGEMASLARRLLSLGKEGLGADFAEINLLETVMKSLDLARTHRRIRACDVVVSGDRTVTFYGSHRQLSTVVLNLLLNAADATNGHGRMELIVKRRPEGGGILECHDDGPGLPEQIRAKLFTPFTTTKPDGTGLGLVSVRGAAQRHRGSVEYEVSPLGGALFRVILPGAHRG